MDDAEVGALPPPEGDSPPGNFEINICTANPLESAPGTLKSSGTSPPPSPSFSRESAPHHSVTRRVVLELREQLRTSIPALLGMVLYKIPWLLSLGFVGRIGPMELAAAALASALCDVTGMSLSVGLSSAITTLTGQARGELLVMAEASRKDADFKRKVLEQAQASARWRRMGDKKRLDLDDGNGRSGNGEDSNGEDPFASDPAHCKHGSEGASSASTIRTGNVGNGESLSLLPPRSWAEQSSLQAEYGAAPHNTGDNDESERWRGFGPSMDSNLFQSFQSSASADSGPEPPLLPMVFLYRGFFVQLLLVIPVGLWWLKGVYPMLISLGQPDDLSLMTQTYLRILTPGLWSYSINWTLTAWLQAIEMADVPSWAALVGGLLHVPFNLFFIHVMGWGWLGVGAATVMFQVVQPTIMFIYLFATKRGHHRLLDQLGAKGTGRTELSFRAEVYAAVSSPWGIYQYLQLAIPGVLVVSEWWASEVAIFLAGNLEPSPEFALSGMAIYQSINSACFMIPVGISVGGSTRVGNLLGANDPAGAGLACSVCIGTAATLSCMTASFLYLVPHSFLPSLFSTDADVIKETSSTITLLSIYVFADGLQVALNGIIKGCGRQCITVPIVIAAYWLVGVPLAYFLSFVKHEGRMCTDAYFCGIVGLVGGMTAGTWVHFILLLITMTCTINWKKEAKRAHDRLATMETDQKDRLAVGSRNERRVEGTTLKEEIDALHRRTLFRRRKDEDVSIASTRV